MIRHRQPVGDLPETNHRSAADGATAGTPQTTPGFKHNVRLWMLGGPAVLVLLLLGGKVTCIVAALGLMITYAFDLANSREGTLISLWLSSLVVGCTIIYAGRFVVQGAALAFFQLVVVTMYVGLLAMWATLQFQWINIEEPMIYTLMETVLFAGWPLTSAAIITWGAVALGGAKVAAPALLFALYAAIAVHGVAGSHPPTKMKPDAAKILVASMLFLPSMMHLVIHSGFCNGWRTFLELIWLLAVPWLLLWSLTGKGVLWWLPLSQQQTIQEKALVVVVPVALCLTVESSVSLYLMNALKVYFYSTESPTWNHGLMSSAVYLAVAGLYFGAANGRQDRTILRVATILSGHCFGQLFGLSNAHQLLLDMLVLCLAVFIHSRELKHYMLLVLGCAVTMLLLLYRSPLWFLDWQFTLSSGPLIDLGVGPVLAMTFSLSVKGFIMLAVLLCVVSVSLAGTMFMGSGGVVPEGVTGLLLTAQAAGITLAEMLLRSVGQGIGGSALGKQSGGVDGDGGGGGGGVGESGDEGVGGAGKGALFEEVGSAVLGRAGESAVAGRAVGVYPIGLMILTSAFGLALVFRLSRGDSRQIQPIFTCLAGCLYFAKGIAAVLTMLVKRSGGAGGGYGYSVTEAFFPIFSLLLTLTAPSVLYRNDGVGSMGTGVSHLSAVEGLLVTLSVCTALWFSADVLLEPVLRLVLGGGMERGVNDAEMVSLAGIILGTFLLWLVNAHFSGNMKEKRAAAALLVCSVVLAVIQPELAHLYVERSSVGVAAWCLLTACIVGVLAMIGVLPVAKSALHRLLFSVGLGGALGLAMSLTALPVVYSARVYQRLALWVVTLLHAPFVIMFVLALLVLLEVIHPRPRARATRTLPRLYTALLVLFPCGYLLHVVVVIGTSGLRRAREGGALTAVTELFLAVMATVNLIVALGLKATAAVAAAGAARGGDGVSAGRRLDVTTARSRAHLRTGSGLTAGVASVAALESARWLPVMGNVSCLLAFIGSLSLVTMRSRAERAQSLSILPLCSIFLLLHNDGRLLAGLRDRNAHVPSIAAASVLLAMSAFYYILVKGFWNPVTDTPLSLSVLGRTMMYGTDHHHLASERAVSLWTRYKSDGGGGVGGGIRSMWTPVLNLLLTCATLPCHYRFVKYLYAHHRQNERDVLWAVGINVLPMVMGELMCIRLLGVIGLIGGAMQLWLADQHRRRGMAAI